MHGKIGITSLESLMSDFLPTPHPSRKVIPNIFANVPNFSSESEMYTWMVDLLNGSKLFYNHTFVATPYKADIANPSRQPIDCGMYHRKLPPLEDKDSENQETVHIRLGNWSRLDMAIVCKLQCTNQDPFDERQADCEPVSVDRKKVLGQILSSAELVFNLQQRTFQFMVLFLGHHARVVYIDRSGAYASYKFKYTTQGAALTRFLVRYSRLVPTARGFDPTAHRIEPDSKLGRKLVEWGKVAAKADPEDHVQQFFNQSLDSSWALWKLEVHVEEISTSSSGRTRVEIQNFVVGKPHFQAGGVACRGTRGYVAVRVNAEDELEGPFVYLKDAWRVDHDYPGIEREGSVLQTLNSKETPFVPTLVCHGDLKGATQVTRSQAVWEKANKGKKGSMKRHQHYRLVVAEVGKPLDQFDRGFTLVVAVLCCIIAHAHAYKKAGIIHRDISAGNILLYKAADGSWVGLLNDWELAKVVGVSEVRQQADRMGTWRFMSAHALDNPSKEIDIPDEIESFCHVLLYYAVRFLPHNINPANVGQFLVDYFDGYSNVLGYYRCGSHKYTAMSTGVIELRQYNGDKTAPLTFMRSTDQASDSSGVLFVHPINKIFKTLLSWLHAHYSLDVRPAPPIERVEEPMPDSDRKEWLAFQAILSDLEESEPAGDKNTGLDLAADGSSSSNPSTEQSTLPSYTMDAASLRAIAEKVQTHSSVIWLILDQMENVGWPCNDKGPDLKPAINLVPRSESTSMPRVFQGSTASMSMKRQLEDPEIPSSKRPRFEGAT
ncbi:hypothetical protein L226DRAFT_163386 [Lentinus tigrinus ALCF2SS1-7]|uniref:Fungal-type protein kinase domain-containing protein n=1 Tax=Lentinus tigrinus ALCF2SS1-6 TaxID=1328759 RepID=A0A5C2S2T5_9APHY|nr:hypothetical protein L227DRAFT_551733 [Lentinus tigrinus ALCF2SS1-6]RPD71838.1 hypothetical protein L226DRAFT_163386 [Lentinus tigrinus ALCF2SS1-7]